VTETERKRAAVRYDCMQWALLHARHGEDAQVTIARAELYLDFVLAPEGAALAGMNKEAMNLE
jgi:hypothetical protein